MTNDIVYEGNFILNYFALQTIYIKNVWFNIQEKINGQENVTTVVSNEHPDKYLAEIPFPTVNEGDFNFQLLI